MTVAPFDTLSVARDLEAAGVERRQAEAHVETLRQATSAGQKAKLRNPDSEIAYVRTSRFLRKTSIPVAYPWAMRRRLDPARPRTPRCCGSPG